MKNKLLYISALVLMMSNFLFAQGSTPPVNANCEGAIFIAPSASECNSTVVSFENMNVFNGCYGEAELWYKTVVPESGVLVIVTDIEGTSSSNDPAITIYQGPCGSLGEPVIDCQEGLARATFQNVGDTILITIANLLDNMTTMCIFEPTINTSISKHHSQTQA